jgi:hypothetical protein
MRVPCPIPLRGPWASAGYQVIQIAEEHVPGAPPRTGCSGLPSSPVGYRVVQVAEEQMPVARRAPVADVRLRRPRRPPQSAAPWGTLSAGVVGSLAFFVILVVVGLALQGTEPPHSDIAFAPPVNVPPAKIVVAPAGCAMPAGWQREAVVNLVEDVTPAAEERAKPQLALLPADKNDKAGRETFGTAVQFARNPNEALRAAGQERKLAFLLHVSGDFEDSRFT